MTAVKMVGLAAATAAMAIGLAAGTAPASAAPTATAGHTLNIQPYPGNPSAYLVTVKGVFPMDEYSAHGYINNISTGERPGGIEFNIHADDEGGDPRLSGLFIPGTGPRDNGDLRAQSDGIHYFQTISVPKNLLNEDSGVFDDNDEIFAYVRFVDGDSGVRRAYTNAITALFG